MLLDAEGGGEDDVAFLSGILVNLLKVKNFHLQLLQPKIPTKFENNKLVSIFSCIGFVLRASE